MIDLFLTEIPIEYSYTEQLINHVANQDYSASHGNSADGRLMTKNAADTAASLIGAPQQRPGTPL